MQRPGSSRKVFRQSIAAEEGRSVMPAKKVVAKKVAAKKAALKKMPAKTLEAKAVKPSRAGPKPGADIIKSS